MFQLCNLIYTLGKFMLINLYVIFAFLLLFLLLFGQRSSVIHTWPFHREDVKKTSENRERLKQSLIPLGQYYMYPIFSIHCTMIQKLMLREHVDGLKFILEVGGGEFGQIICSYCTIILLLKDNHLSFHSYRV